MPADKEHSFTMCHKDPLLHDVRGLFPEEIGAWLEGQGEKNFRGKQIFQWLHARCASTYEEMTDISQALQQKMAGAWPICPLSIRQEQVSRDGTRKYLFELSDGQRIETVLMAHREDSGHIRHTLCLSTQVGCAMGCVFCATGEGGFTRNLTAAEIVGQVLDVTASRRKEQPGFEVHNLVYMGMGEPLLNYDAVLRSIRLLNHPKGQKIGIRRITVSTCGIPEMILRLAHEGLDITLALSLHSPDPELRSQLMPVNRRFPLSEVMEACREYVMATGRRMTFEYTMIQGVNMGPAHAEALCCLLKNIQCNVNLIPVNIGRHGYQKPGRAAQEAFRKKLMEGGLEAVIREEKGSDIAGACGQLAGQTKQGE